VAGDDKLYCGSLAAESDAAANKATDSCGWGENKSAGPCRDSRPAWSWSRSCFCPNWSASAILGRRRVGQRGQDGVYQSRVPLVVRHLMKPLENILGRLAVFALFQLSVFLGSSVSTPYRRASASSRRTPIMLARLRRCSTAKSSTWSTKWAAILAWIVFCG
jgi:hypothetical protein